MKFNLFRKPTKRRLAASFLMLLVLISVSGFLYVKFAFGVTRTWDGGGATNNWSDCVNWSADTCPGTLDVAAFDGTSSKSATIDVAIDVGGINIGSGYGGTITQASGITINVRASDFVVAGGTFTGGDSTITLLSSFSQTGGTFTNTTSTFTQSLTSTKTFTLNGGSFSNPGTVKFTASNALNQTLTCTGTFPGTVDVAQTIGSANFILSSGCSITLATTVTTQGSINNSGTINATNINMNDSINGNNPAFTQSGTLNLTGTLKFGASHSGSQTLSCTGNLTNSGGVVDIAQTTGATSFTLGSGCEITLASTVTTDGSITNNGIMDATNINVNDSASSQNVNFTQNGRLNLSGTLKFGSTHALTNQLLTCTGQLTGSGGVVDIAQTAFTQTFTLSSGCTATLASSVTTKGNITNNGTMNATNITFNNSSSSISQNFTQNGTINLSGTLSFALTGANSSSTLTCSGIFPGTVDIAMAAFGDTFTLSSGCTVTLAASVTTKGNIVNNGTMNATNITLNNSTGSSNQSFTQSGTLNLSGTLSFAQTATSSTNTLTCTGNFPGTVDVAETVSGATFVLSSGCSATFASALSTTGSMTINGNATGTNMTVGTSVTLGSTGTLSLSGSLTFNSANGSGLTCTNPNLSTAVVVNKSASGNTFGLGSSCKVSDFTLTQGTFSNPGSNMTLSITGNFSQNANTAIGGANLTLAFTGSGTQTISKTTGTIISPISVNKTGGSASLSTTLGTSAAATVSAGMFDINGQTFTTPQSFTIQNGGTLQLIGSESPPAPTLNSGSTVSYKGASGTNSYTIANWSYSNLQIAQAAGANTFNLPNDLTLTGGVNIIAGTLDAVSGSNFNLTVGGNWGNSGTFTPRSATVTFNDITQPSKISGTTTFNNLTVSTPSKKMWFKSGSSTTISGALTMTGAAGRYVQLQSQTSGSQWNIISNGTASLSYLEVQDSNACSGTTLVPTSSVNLGNNSCWTLGSQQTNSSKVRRGTKFIRGSRIQ